MGQFTLDYPLPLPLSDPSKLNIHFELWTWLECLVTGCLDPAHRLTSGFQPDPSENLTGRPDGNAHVKRALIVFLYLSSGVKT